MTTTLRTLLSTLILVSVLVCRGAPVPDARVGLLLAELPTSSAKESRRVARELVSLGAPGIRQMVSMLTPRGTKPGDVDVRRAIRVLTIHTSRPGAVDEQRLFTNELARAVAATTEPEIRVFLIEELEVGGARTAAKALIPLLNDPELAHSASRAMLKLDPPLARRELRRALESATTSTQRTLVQALGETKDRTIVTLIAPVTKSPDTMLRLEALFALAGTGELSAGQYLEPLPVSQDRFVAAKEISSLLLYVRSLAARGHTGKAVEICNRFLDAPLESGSDHLHCAAIGCLVEILGKGAQPYLLKSMSSPSRQVRAAALKHAAKQTGPQVTRAWVRRMESAPVEVRAEIVGMLAERGDAPAVAAIVACLDDSATTARLAAIRASGTFHAQVATRYLLPFMKTAPDEELKAVRDTFAHLQDPTLNRVLAEASGNFPVNARVALFEALEARGAADQVPTLVAATKESDPRIRFAALNALGKLARPEDLAPLVDALLRGGIEKTEEAAARKAVVTAGKAIPDAGARTAPLLAQWDSADTARRVIILDVLARLGGQQAFEAIRSSATASDEQLRDTAVRLLAEWPDTAAAPELLKIARDTNNAKHHAIVLQGYIRLAGSEGVATDARLAMCRDAIAAARRPEERKQALALVGTIETTAALELALPLLADQPVKQDAAQAICLITVPQKPGDTALDGPAAAKALGSAIEVLEDRRLVRKARTRLVKLNADASTESAQLDDLGFSSLFNGKDLTGWTGATDVHTVQNGVIICPEGAKGNLFTQKEYSDFHLRLDYKLGPGGNNGVGIRAPLEGTPAFTGMEIQILDDTHEKWRTLLPWQLNGGIYGVAAAKSGQQKPVGEWNTQEIIARGKQIEVILNGEGILDVNLDDVASTGTIDQAPHPGLYRSTGHIGLLGHDDRVEFRNVSICEFKPFP